LRFVATLPPDFVACCRARARRMQASGTSVVIRLAGIARGSLAGGGLPGRWVRLSRQWRGRVRWPGGSFLRAQVRAWAWAEADAEGRARRADAASPTPTSDAVVAIPSEVEIERVAAPGPSGVGAREVSAETADAESAVPETRRTRERRRGKKKAVPAATTPAPRFVMVAPGRYVRVEEPETASPVARDDRDGVAEEDAGGAPAEGDPPPLTIEPDPSPGASDDL
jgi:hypothetical protein